VRRGGDRPDATCHGGGIPVGRTASAERPKGSDRRWHMGRTAGRVGPILATPLLTLVVGIPSLVEELGG